MRYAKIGDETVEAAAGGPRKAHCHACGEMVFLRCPQIIIPHWVHNAGSECVHAGKAGLETDWHKDWKSTVPAQYREKSIRRNGKLRRADIKAATQTVIELQHSQIATEEVESREEFYGKNMFWLFDADGRKRVFRRYNATYVAPIVPGMKVYECEVFDKIAGLYEAKRAKLIDMQSEVVRIIPHHANNMRRFICHIQDAGVVRNQFSDTCDGECPVVNPFLMNVSPDWAPKKLIQNQRRACATSSGKYMTDYCPRGYIPQQKLVTHLDWKAWAWIGSESET